MTYTIEPVVLWGATFYEVLDSDNRALTLVCDHQLAVNFIEELQNGIAIVEHSLR